jgi:hypothetical protein
MQRTALHAAADAERYADKLIYEKHFGNHW